MNQTTTAVQAVLLWAIIWLNLFIPPSNFSCVDIEAIESCSTNSTPINKYLLIKLAIANTIYMNDW